MTKRSFIIILVFSVLSVRAQEQISVLEMNPLIKQIKDQNYKVRLNSNLRLPFLDDFSYDSYSPDSELWENSSVFINRSYPMNPVTLGVATFDGLRSNGMPYDISLPNTWGPADTLTSRAIDLHPDTSVYLIFYYQAAGLGDNPQIEDSLVLEFCSGVDTSGNLLWRHIWSTTMDTTTQEFTKIELIIDSVFLHDSFRFRFRNYATLSGNYDHWHIDYVKLDKYISGQIPPLEDVAFVYQNPQLLKRYREMPWTHYLLDPTDALRDTLDIILRNNDAGLSVDYQYDIYLNSTLIEHYPYQGTVNSSRNIQIDSYDNIGNFTFSQPPIFLSDSIFKSSNTDSAVFLFKNIIKTSSSDFKQNDTLSHLQRFNSHFSYDDGIAEFAYGINVQGAKMAYQFKLNKLDSLRVIQIYFAPMKDDVSHIPFHLVVWDDNNGSPGNILFRSDSIYPVYHNRAIFHSYELSVAVAVDGIFYVGIEQETNDMLNIGLDRNSPVNNYMFYNVGGGWNNSQFPGAWMIRPLLSESPIILLGSPEITQEEILIYPNPFSHYANIKLNNDFNNHIRIFDVTGKLLEDIRINQDSFVFKKESLLPGIYIMNIQNKKGSFSRKIIIY